VPRVFVAVWFLCVGLVISWEPRNCVEKYRGRGAAGGGGGGGEFFFVFTDRLFLLLGVRIRPELGLYVWRPSRVFRLPNWATSWE
jgi:hypothetical protein